MHLLAEQHCKYSDKNGPETDTVYEKYFANTVDSLPDNIDGRQDQCATYKNQSCNPHERHGTNYCCLEQDD